MAGVAAFCRRAADAVLVSGDLFTDGMTYPAETERYLQVLAGVNRRLAGIGPTGWWRSAAAFRL